MLDLILILFFLMGQVFSDFDVKHGVDLYVGLLCKRWKHLGFDLFGLH